MTNLNTKTIINTLPLPAELKLDLLEKYDTLDRKEQLRISDLVWDTYYQLYDIKVKENFDKLIAEAEKNGEELGDNFYGKVVEKTDQEFNEQLQASGESVDIGAARKSLEQIMHEINASKMVKKPQV